MSYIETRLIIDGKSYDGRQIELIELGRNVERSRIIKLLEERKQKVGHSLDKIGAEAREYWQIKCRVLELETAIALIKGEK